MAQYKGLAKHYGFSLDTPVCELPEKIVNILLYGSGMEKIEFSYDRESGGRNYKSVFEGIIPNLERRHLETSSNWVRAEIESYMSSDMCPDCKGKRLRPEILAVTVGGINIAEMCDLSISKLQEFFDNLKLSEKDKMIAEEILKEIKARVAFLKNVGLEYLTLSRAAGTLSGGEAQRIRLATQIGSGLVGVLYILDEPSIGLHQRDNSKLIETLQKLRDIGNTVIVVEHDEETMLASDYLVDIGPGAGVHGGEIVAAGTPEQVMSNHKSITGAYLSRRKCIPIPKTRRTGNGTCLKVFGAYEHNLRHIDVEIPLGCFVCVTGVSGSGKSSLVNGIIAPVLSRELNHAIRSAGKYKKIEGISNLDKVIAIDQSPIGRTPRSNPATYTGLFTDIRDLFANTTDAKAKGYKAGRFSFNIRGGRCEACEGDGVKKIEMHFLPDVYVTCDVCHGHRYNRDTLEVRYKGKNISEVLEMTVEEALSFFDGIPRIKAKLQTLYDVGLGYVKIGQSSTTLSGGEAQRVKLATELAKRGTGKTLYILDEPTTGLHSDDISKLIAVLQRLCDAGNTLLVIEHNLDVIKTADHIIDLGPEGGDRGGTVIATGTPEEVARNKQSYTGVYLNKIFSELK